MFFLDDKETGAIRAGTWELTCLSMELKRPDGKHSFAGSGMIRQDERRRLKFTLIDKEVGKVHDEVLLDTYEKVPFQIRGWWEPNMPTVPQLMRWLITRDAWAQLQRRDAAWVDPARSGKTPSDAFDIVSRARLQPPEEHAQLLFPMTHNGEKLAAAWLKAAHAILPWLEAGKDVLFLVEGDASTYATFGHLARTVQQLDADIPVRTIAGVNSFTSACADAGIALAEQDDTIAIIPAAYGVSAIDRHLKDFDTLVLMKIKPLLNELLDWLEQRDLLEEAWFIERSGAEDERHLSGRELLTLRDTKISYLSLMIIKHPHRVRGERIKGCLKKNSNSEATA